MNKYDIFFSWQSDIKVNRNLIEKAIKRGYGKCKDIGVFNIVSDSRDRVGSPDIAHELFNKIVLSNIFVADLTIVNKNIINKILKKRYTPNPNVMIEVGYAYHALGEEKMLLLFNSDYCKVEELPFDINHKRAISFNANNIDGIIENITKTIISLNKDNRLYNVYVDERFRRPEFEVLFAKGKMEDSDDGEYFKNIDLLDFNEGGCIKVTLRQNIDLEKVEKYKKLEYNEQIKKLGISQFDINDYNEQLPNSDDVEKYVNEYNYFLRKNKNGIPIEITIKNTGNCKASDVLVEISCDDSIRFCKTDDCQFAEEPKQLSIPENPISIAINKKLSSGIDNCLNNIQWHNDGIVLSPLMTRGLIGVNKHYEFKIVDGVILAKYENGILHEDNRVIRGISMVPTKKGVFDLIITIKCEENERQVIIKKKIEVI